MLNRLSAAGPVLALLLLFALLSAFVPNFLGTRNFQFLMLSVSLVGAIATTMMLVLALREVDLSVASVVALAGVLCAETISRTGTSTMRLRSATDRYSRGALEARARRPASGALAAAALRSASARRAARTGFIR